VKLLTVVSVALTFLAISTAVAHRDNPIDVAHNNDPQRNIIGRSSPDGSNDPSSARLPWLSGDGLWDEQHDTRDVVRNWYVVRDWSANDLRPPPVGYHWIQFSNRYMLTKITSGVISEIIPNDR
jgi:Ni/Co efflux regulator RcnB